VRALAKPLLNALRPDSHWWRRAILFGVDRGPDAFVRLSPPLFGFAFGLALPGQRQRVRENLRRIMGERPAHVELREVAEVFANYASCLTEALLLGSGRPYPLRSRPRGVEHYQSCAAHKKGVILATAHTGGWEIAGPVLRGVHPGEVLVAMRRERDDDARALQDRSRTRTGVRVVHIGEDPLDALPLLQHLRKGAAVAMQIDRVPTGMRSRPVTFFGEPWHAPEGILRLASLSGAPIMPVFTRRVGFMEYEATVSRGIFVPRRATDEELDDAAQRMIRALEQFVSSYPTQWFHFDETPPA
jgi:lauroyl/myristoyl acyltransferase